MQKHAKRRKTYEKTIIKTVSFSLIMCSLILGSCRPASAASVNWSVYYASGGGNGENKVVSLPTYGGTYRAKCDNVSGSCTYKAVTITAYKNSGCSNKIGLSTSVKFSGEGKCDFKLTSVPAVSNIFFLASLSHTNGSSASASGLIKTL